MKHKTGFSSVAWGRTTWHKGYALAIRKARESRDPAAYVYTCSTGLITWQANQPAAVKPAE